MCNCVHFLVFGVDLTTLVKLEGKIIPSILSDCIKEIESREKGKLMQTDNICLLQWLL